MKKTIVMAALACTAMVSMASAQSLTTLFANNNAGSPGGGVYFDVTVGANPLEITGFDVNSSAAAGTAIAFEVFTRSGTASGSEQSNVGWTSVATGVGSTAGAGLPGAVTLNASFVLPANSVIGMAITLGSAAGHAYTNGNVGSPPYGGGGNQTYSNADLTLDLGAGNNAIFASGLFQPRIWNGTIYYNVIPAPASLALLGLGGLVAVRRRR